MPFTPATAQPWPKPEAVPWTTTSAEPVTVRVMSGLPEKLAVISSCQG